jgi:hypothetical protein
VTTPDPADAERTRSILPYVIVVSGAILVLVGGWWWRFAGEHLEGSGGSSRPAVQVGQPVHIGVRIATEGGGEVTLEEARVRTVEPEDIATVEVGSVQRHEVLDVLLGADITPFSFGAVSDVTVDGDDQYLVVSFLSDEPGVFVLNDVVARYRAGFRRRARVAEFCAVVTVTEAPADTPVESLSEDDTAILRQAESATC